MASKETTKLPKLTAPQSKTIDTYVSAVEQEGKALIDMLRLWIKLAIPSSVLLGLFQMASTDWKKENGKYLSVNDAANAGCLYAIAYRNLLNNGKKRFVLEGKRGEIKPKADDKGEPIRKVSGSGSGNGSNKKRYEHDVVEKAFNMVIDQYRVSGELTKAVYTALRIAAEKISKEIRLKSPKFTKPATTRKAA